MTQDSSVRSFKCPTCGAPLEPEAGKSTMKCSYCGDTIIIPKAARIPAAAPAPRPKTQSSAFQTPHPSSAVSKEAAPSAGSGAKPASKIPGILIAVVLVVAFGAVAYFAFGAGIVSSMLFSHPVTSFGSQGIGQGMFQDPRAIGVDGSGNVVVADYSDGRVQVFSPDGKFISLFNLDKSAITYVQSMAVSHDGKIYLPGARAILVYDEKGQALGQIGSTRYTHDDLTLGPDGTLYVLSNTEDIIRLKSDGSVDLQIPKAVSSVSGQQVGEPHLAVDGLGNMYVVDDTAKAVFKYSPAGKFINQFGEPFQFSASCRNCSTFKPGTFYQPNGIAVDGYGRVFVADYDATQVFDSSGKFLNNLSGGFFGIALDGQGNLYATSMIDHNVAKYQISKP